MLPFGEGIRAKVNVALWRTRGQTRPLIGNSRSKPCQRSQGTGPGLASTVLVSAYVVRIKTMWRQAPITAAVVIAAAISSESSAIGIQQGLHKVAEVVFGCLVGMTISLVMSRVWLIQPSTENAAQA